MAIFQLIYSSKPFGFDESILNSLLIESRHNNKMENITGALICRADLYMQLLEGNSESIETTFTKICRDDRHIEVQKLLFEETKNRLFPDWAMRDDPARTWFWSKEDVENGALLRASKEEILGAFKRVAKEILDD